MKTNKPAHDITVDAEAFFNSADVARTMMEFRRKQRLFSQDDPCKNVMYILPLTCFDYSYEGGRPELSLISESSAVA
jgi:hypothetical protein